jgi:AraC family L-rhamnose operon regulatory protein RhaS
MRTLNTNVYSEPKDFPFAVEWSDSRERIQSPPESYHKIVIILAGRALHVAEGTALPVAAADAFFVQAGTIDEYRKEENLRFINIYFRPESLGRDLFDLPQLNGYRQFFSLQISGRNLIRLNPKQIGTALCHVETLAHELQKKTPGYIFQVHALFLQLICFLSRADCRSSETSLYALSCVGRALSHLETHFDEPISLDELARLAHMSKRNFNRAFRAATNTTPIAYLEKIRLTRAAAMLLQYEESVTSVAYKVGYCDSNYFARRFSAMFGIPPSKYRKLQSPAASSLIEQNLSRRSLQRVA